ncbi:DsbC family protein [Novosphingobium sp. KA1]|uniref:DsbC family protein n=1 Tax=Novosphingobium sp. (strain KA1) TaxID=164608 RepID=UPI001A8D14FA|nr:DsbC family protein [Novosphingobium sp. KA1]QSR19709.1 protein-disulfide isomerase [Novosphingobium sp. KA1]
MRRITKLAIGGALLSLGASTSASAGDTGKSKAVSTLQTAAAEAEKRLHQTFTNLAFEEFGPAPVHGTLYQALAGGKVIYFAPESEHLIFGAVYDRNGANLTALAQDAAARKRMHAIDPADALLIGPDGAPKVIEFTDPDCPYCQALERFWISRIAEGQPVQRQVYFVSGIHPDAAAKAEHILCSPDPEREFKAIYAGARPAPLRKCKAGAERVARETEAIRKMGISGTPTLIVDGKLVSGFQQGELQAFLDTAYAKPAKDP